MAETGGPSNYQNRGQILNFPNISENCVLTPVSQWILKFFKILGAMMKKYL